MGSEGIRVLEGERSRSEFGRCCYISISIITGLGVVAEEDNKLRERSRGGWVAGITGTVVSWGAAIAFMRLCIMWCGFRGGALSIESLVHL